jgi:hypothetical protein
MTFGLWRKRDREPDPVVSLLTGTGIFTKALLLGEPRPWVHEPWEMYQRRMIGRKFERWLAEYKPDADLRFWPTEDLEAAFRAGYDQRAGEDE